MESILVFLTLSSLLLFSSAVDARKDPAGYWEDVMKDQPMPVAIQGLLLSNPESLSMEKSKCHTPLETQKVDKLKLKWDLNLQSSAILYHGRDEKKEDKTPMKDFEPRTSVSVHIDGEGK